MNWLDRIIDRHGDVIFICLTVIVATIFVYVTYLSFHWGVRP